KMVNNKMADGSLTNYHPNGKILSVVKVVNGFNEGPIKYYYPDGQIEKEGEYKAGVEAGIWKSYYPNGKLEDQEQYEEKGKKNGASKFYTKEGKIYLEITTVKDELISYKYFDKNGKVTKEGLKQKGSINFPAFNSE